VGRSHTPRTVANSAGAGEPVEGAAATTASLGGGGGGGGGGTHRHHHLHHHRATTHNDVTATDDSFTFFPGDTAAATAAATPPPSGSIQAAAAARMRRRALDVYFSQGKRGRWVPRSILIDLEPSVIDGIRGGALGKLFRPDGVVCARGGRGGGGAVTPRQLSVYSPLTSR
jgi:hypothetical protein